MPPPEFPSCTVVVPCKNEAGNIAEVVRRVPDMGSHTELLFVDGSSTDGTPALIERLIKEHPERDIKLARQGGGKGKAAAVFQGFELATGDILMILDADMTVAPESLPLFYRCLAEGTADFANGARFAYPMERGAMPRLNVLGNQVFAQLLSWILGTPIGDSLCGTKAIFKRDWLRMARIRPRFGGFDPWGDFDLLLSAAYLGLRIVDIPIRYGARTAGESKMRPFEHGLTLARTCLAGFRELRLRRAEPHHES